MIRPENREASLVGLSECHPSEMAGWQSNWNVWPVLHFMSRERSCLFSETRDAGSQAQCRFLGLLSVPTKSVVDARSLTLGALSRLIMPLGSFACPGSPGMT